jgi:hypothetical protein
MKIFRPYESNRVSNTVYVAPAAMPDGKGVSEWLRADGEPMAIAVEFKSGVAEVAGNLGRWMIANGHAQASPILLTV